MGNTELQESILSLARSGVSTRQIAKSLGCSKDYVTRIRNRHKTPDRVGRPITYSPDKLKYAELLLEDGCSYHDVAETTMIPRTTLREKFPGKGFSPEDTKGFGLAIIKTPDYIKNAIIRKNILR